jgi:NADPH:quinone reductase-like Zn-dependent oxidoreductase
MRAIEVTETGGPEVLTYVDKPRPSPGPGEVLIKAEAIGVNFPSRLHLIRTRDEFTWRTNQVFDAITSGTVKVSASAHYPLEDAAQAHRELEGRRTVGSVVLTP